MIEPDGWDELEERDGVSTRLSEDPALGRPEYGHAAWKSPDGSVWLAGGKGVFPFRDGRETARPGFPASHRETWTLSGTRTAGGLWARQGPGKLLALHGDRFEVVTYPGQGREPVTAIHEEEDGTLWVGTRGGGLYRRDIQGQWRRFGKSDGLPSEVIRFLALAPDGGLWIGTAGAGLVLHRKGVFSSVARSRGLPDDSVSQLVTDNAGRLWLGTNRGLAEGRDFADLHPLVINLSDGLPSEEFTIVPPVKASDGTLVFATTKGFVRLDPALFHRDSAQPPVFIRSIRANGRELPVFSGIQAEEQWLTLPPGVERLEFEFTALHFEAPERLVFRSHLSGPDAEGPAADAGQVSPLRARRSGGGSRAGGGGHPGNFHHRAGAHALAGRDRLGGESGAGHHCRIRGLSGDFRTKPGARHRPGAASGFSGKSPRASVVVAGPAPPLPGGPRGAAQRGQTLRGLHGSPDSASQRPPAQPGGGGQWPGYPFVRRARRRERRR